LLKLNVKSYINLFRTSLAKSKNAKAILFEINQRAEQIVVLYFILLENYRCDHFNKKWTCVCSYLYFHYVDWYFNSFKL